MFRGWTQPRPRPILCDGDIPYHILHYRTSFTTSRAAHSVPLLNPFRRLFNGIFNNRQTLYRAYSDTNYSYSNRVKIEMIKQMQNETK